ncbi:unnamed protein product [Pleuronectes platessa]|uniref:Uncharacterized protein n=1 Tax=Pleuronectes platessa TaxID=8262 RepID=A0A9N7Z602_PLEPL|nr:unnamed protein product [Pleuronectes platessa]
MLGKYRERKHREKKPKSLEVEAATCGKLTDLFGAGFTSPAAAGAPGDERGGLDNDERVEADMVRPKGDETAAGENSNYGTELQKGGGRDELEEREEVEKPPPSPFFYSSKQTPPLSPFEPPLSLVILARCLAGNQPSGPLRE